MDPFIHFCLASKMERVVDGTSRYEHLSLPLDVCIAFPGSWADTFKRELDCCLLNQDNLILASVRVLIGS